MLFNLALALIGILAVPQSGQSQRVVDPRTAHVFVVHFGTELARLAYSSAPDARARFETHLEENVDFESVLADLIAPMQAYGLSEAREMEFRQALTEHVVELVFWSIRRQKNRLGAVAVQGVFAERHSEDLWVSSHFEREGEEPKDVRWKVTTGSGRPRVAEIEVDGVQIVLMVSDQVRDYIQRAPGFTVEGLITELSRSRYSLGEE